jgi:hypothetical protein
VLDFSLSLNEAPNGLFQIVDGVLCGGSVDAPRTGKSDSMLYLSELVDGTVSFV